MEVVTIATRYGDTRIEDLRFRRAETYNLKLTIDPSKEKDRLKELSHSIKKMDEELKQLEDERKKTIAAHKQAMNNDAAYSTQFKTEMAHLTVFHKSLSITTILMVATNREHICLYSLNGTD